MASIASVDGRIVSAPAFSIAEWTVLQGHVRAGTSSVTLPFCHCPGHLSISSRGTQFFRHFANQTDCVFATAGESEEHLFAKHEIAAGTREAGWLAKVEASSPRKSSRRWRADVLATGGSSQVAFEVQRSHQPADEYIFRSNRYRQSHVDCLWFIYGDRAGHARLRHLDDQVFLIEIGFDTATVVQLGDDGTKSVPLREFVTHWLQGRRPKRPRILKPTLEIPAQPHTAKRSTFRHLPAIGEPEMRNGVLEVPPTRICEACGSNYSTQAADQSRWECRLCGDVALV